MDAARVKAIALAAGASAAGIAPATDLAEFRRFSEAVTIIPADLGYLKREPLKRKSVKKWYADARAVLVCAFRYWAPGMDYPAALAAAGDPAAFLAASGRKACQPKLLAAPGARVSRYALCRDYHLTVKEKLGAMLSEIKKEEPAADGKVFCDTSPVMEKELGRLAGLGFRGKNTLLLSRSLGSYFFLGGIALNFQLQPDAPSEDSCGACEQCVKACPTKALKNGRLDSARCISYWTTQARWLMPVEVAERNPGWAYGCDLCQEACPNNKAPGSAAPGFEPIKK
jgi:epoxyqueuosine reductase QueG